MNRVSLLAALVALSVAAGAPAHASPLQPDSIELVLAASWHAGFCASRAGRDKADCQGLTPDGAYATQFSLHGLWPDDLDDRAIFPCYCDRGAPRSCRESLPRDAAIELSPHVREKLARAMPGMRSGLHLHEWTKHGSCYEDDKTGDDRGADPDEYFGDAIALLAALNASPVRTLFAENLGAVLTRREIEAAFDAAFGAGAGERLIVRCGEAAGDVLITELWIGLAGDVGRPVDLAKLMLAAPPRHVSSRQTSCDGGRVAKLPAS